MIAESEYKKILEQVPVACVDLVIHIGEKFVLFRRNNEPARGKWWLPGGAIRKGETLEEAVMRKAQEETGLDVKIERFVANKETIFDTGPFGLKSLHTINSVFLVSPLCGKFDIRLDSQHSEYREFDRIEESMDPYVKEMIERSGILKNNVNIIQRD